MKLVKNANYNKDAKNADYIFGSVAIAVSLLSPGIFLLAIAAAGVFEGFGGGLRVFLGGILFTTVWAVLGIRALIRTSRSQRYSDAFASYPRMKVAEIMARIGRPLRTVSAEMSVLQRRGYFREMRFDLDRKEVIFAADSVLLPEVKGDTKTMYKESRGFNVWGFLVAFATLFPFMQFENIPLLLFGFAAAVGSSTIVHKFFPAPVYWNEVKRTTKLKRPIVTGHGDLDSMLGRIYENKCELVRLVDAIRTEKIRDPIELILAVLDQITAYVTENPDKAKNLRQFANYYLPTTVDLLKNYEELEAKPDSLKGENICEAMAKIEGHTADMIGVFKREYDGLFVDRVMDISAEVGVMQSIIKENKGE
jgi:hypothetical protein